MFDEKRLIEITKPYLEKCRPGDFNHSLRVVKWVKVLGKDNENLKFIIIAAYLHDVGWSGILDKEKIDLDEMKELEKMANKNTEPFARKILEKLNLNEKEIKLILNLIVAADKHESKSEDEEIIVDADNLSKLCVEHVKEKYSNESYTKIIELWEKEFPRRIKTEKGKKEYPLLLKKLRKSLI